LTTITLNEIKNTMKSWLEQYRPPEGSDTFETWLHAFLYLSNYSDFSSSRVLQTRLSEFFLAREGELTGRAIQQTSKDLMESYSIRQSHIQHLLDGAIEQLDHALNQSCAHKEHIKKVLGKIQKVKDLNSLEEIKMEISELGEEMVRSLEVNEETLTQSMKEYRFSMDSLSEELSKFTKEAMESGITGVHPRDLLENDLDHYLLIARERHQTLGILVFRIDGFADSKSRFGIEASQGILNDFADILRQNLRQSDSIYAYQEDTFLIILPRCTAVSGKHLTQRVERFLNSHIYRFGDHNLRIKITSSFQMLLNKEDSTHFLKRAMSQFQ